MALSTLAEILLRRDEDVDAVEPAVFVERLLRLGDVQRDEFRVLGRRPLPRS